MILHCLRLGTGRVADTTDITNLTTSTRTAPARWIDCLDHAGTPSGCLDMPLAPDPSEEEGTAIRRRLVTVDAAEEQNLLNTVAAAADPATPAWVLPLYRDILSRYGE